MTKEEFKNEIACGRFRYDWSSRRKKSHLFDLYVTVFGNKGVPVATYSIKTQKITLTIPDWYIPACDIIRDFISVCEKKYKENEQ